MGRRRQQKRQVKHVPHQTGDPQHKPDPLVRFIAVHPTKNIVAIAVGTQVRISSYGNDSDEKLSTAGLVGHTGPVRVVAFSPDGKYLLSGGEDKTAKLWDTASWSCVATWKAPKKVSAGAFMHNSKHVLFADKFGDVLIAPCEGAASATPALFLGHLSSVVSSITLTPDNMYVITTDKDRKARVSCMPAEPLSGSVEIQSYCLGHTYFVAAAALMGAPDQRLMATGSGDGTVRLWEYVTPRLLHTFVASEEVPELAEPDTEGGADAEGGDADAAGQQGEAAAGMEVDTKGEEEQAAAGRQQGEGSEEGSEEGGEADQAMHERVTHGPKCAPVVHVASSPDGRVVAVLVEGRDEVLLLQLNDSSTELEELQRLTFPDVRYPCQALFDRDGHLWVAGGPPLDTSTSAHIGVARKLAGGQYEACTSELLGTELRAALEQRKEEEEAQVASGALVPAYTQHLAVRRKRYFSTEHLEQLKKQRRDYAETQRLRARAEEKLAAKK